MTGEVVRVLTLPFDALRTVYAGGASEVRLYRNRVTGALEVGKRIAVLGLDHSLLQEATWLQRIRHDHLVPVESVATVDDPGGQTIEMVMPYYESGSITDALIQGRRFSIREARDIVQAALRGLAELHEVEHVIHRDIKPANIFLTGDAKLARVGDLGIGIRMDELGRAEAYPSAQMYSPPEAFRTKKVDRRSDIYCMGMVLFEMLNGPLPWELYDDRLAMAQRLGQGKPAPLPRHLKNKPHVPPSMRKLLAKCIAADPTRRPATASAMASTLASVQFIDWAPEIRPDGDHCIWTGPCASQPGKQFRVQAERKKTGWTLSGLQRRNTWQRVFADIRVATLNDPEVHDFFDQMVQAATSR